MNLDNITWVDNVTLRPCHDHNHGTLYTRKHSQIEWIGSGAPFAFRRFTLGNN